MQTATSIKEYMELFATSLCGTEGMGMAYGDMSEKAAWMRQAFDLCLVG